MTLDERPEPYPEAEAGVGRAHGKDCPQCRVVIVVGFFMTVASLVTAAVAVWWLV